METLDLTRNDLLQTAATRKKTLIVFPPGANKQQKFGVGDLSGVVQCLSIKKGDCHTSFKSLPTRHRVTAVTLGKGKTQRDKMFVAEDAVVKGLTKKGREFFRFDTNLTESISGIVVLDTQLCILGEYTVLTFLNNKENGVYLSPDRINDADAFLHDEKLTIALACQDRAVRIVHGSTLVHQCSVRGIPTCIVLSRESHDSSSNQRPGATELLFGTDQGELGQLLSDEEGLHGATLLESNESTGSIVALFSELDFTKDGMSDIAVGRDDGMVEIYSVDELGALKCVFQTKLPERINTVTGGFITSSSQQDLLVQTYSGKVIAFCPQGAGLFSLQNAYSMGTNLGSTIQTAERSEALQKRIMDLQSQLRTVSSQVKEKQELNQSLLGVYSSLRGIDISHSCRYQATENCFVLTLEVERPLFCVAFCCDVQIELLEAQNSVAILSQSQWITAHQEYPVSAVYRCQDSANKLDIRFRCQEGNQGTITCFLIPKLSTKFAMQISHQILPLCLHERVLESDSETNLDSTNILTLKGDHRMEEICLLFSSALPDFPKQWPDDQESSLYYHNRHSGNHMEIKQRNQEVFVYCNDIIALEILKNKLIHESDARNQCIKVDTQVNITSVERSLKDLWIELSQCRLLNEKAKTAQALMEIAEQEDELSFLDVSLKNLLQDAVTILDAQKKNSERRETLSDSILSLITHCWRLIGLNCSSATYHQLKDFIEDPKEDASYTDLLKFLSATRNDSRKQV
eukprot:g4656.t1